MKLVSLSVQGLKSLRDRVEIPIKSLSVLIGENDAGKTSVLDAIGYLLTRNIPSPQEYSEIGGVKAQEIVIGGVFFVEPNTLPEISNYLYRNQLIILKTFCIGQPPTVRIQFEKLTDEELANFDGLAAPETQELMKRYGIPAQPNQALRREALNLFIQNNQASLPKALDYHEMDIGKILPFLPIFERYSSADYLNPKNLISKTLSQLYYSYLYDDQGSLRNKTLTNIKAKIEDRLNAQLREKLLLKVQKFNSKVSAIRGDFSFDFSRGFVLNDLSLDEGQGFKLAVFKGEGSRKRLFLSIMEWDKEIQNQVKGKSIIRGYDEPDTSLHYDAQRKMYYTIYETSAIPHSKIQNLIATHSVSMIDRAPADSINHIRIHDGVSRVEYLRNEENDQEMKEFLEQVAEISGIKNSSIFYEKCFLIVEGDSEENVIPLLYKKARNRSLAEDGVVLINIQSNGSWRNFLKLLNQNKQSVTLLLLDNDTQNADCQAKVTERRLVEIGFPPAFLSNNVFFAGLQEFEDLFPDRYLRDVLNELHPRASARKWTLRHIKQIRGDFQKISKGLEELANSEIRHHHKRYSKPEFALKLAQKMKSKDIEKIPFFIAVFNKIRQIVNE